MLVKMRTLEEAVCWMMLCILEGRGVDMFVICRYVVNCNEELVNFCLVLGLYSSSVGVIGKSGSRIGYLIAYLPAYTPSTPST